MIHLKNLDLRNKLIYLTFFATVAFILIYAILYQVFNMKSNGDLSVGVGFTLLIVINAFFVVMVNDLIIKDIYKLREKVMKFKKGNFAEDMKSARNDEIGDIYREVEQIVKNQHNIVNKIKENSYKIDDSTKDVKLLVIENRDMIDELLNNLGIINDGANKQIKGIEEVEFAIEEMAVGINRINVTVADVASNSSRAVEEAKRGNTALERVVMQMNEIQKNSEESMSTIRILGEQIKEIQKIVDVIRTISSRTNLLALNATIEAERAGENGEGFIVVAEEIKDLAVKSTESTVKIEKIARNIMERKDKAIEQIEKSGKEVKSGIMVVNEASQAFNKILHSTGDIGIQLNEVSSSSEQLSSNTNQIVESIEKTTLIAKEFSKNASGLEASVTQQEYSVDKLLNSIDVLSKLTEDINQFINTYNK